MMHMTFYWSRNVTLLFSTWQTTTWLTYTLTLLTCFLFSIFYQYMEDRRLRLKLISSKSTGGNDNTIPLLGNKNLSGGWKVVGSVMFGVNSAIGYFLMLAVMSFNGGVFVAIVVGLAVGYHLFRSGDDEVVVVDNPCACA